MKRRLLAALMCVCMLIGLMPATAMAAPRGNYPDKDASTVEAKFYYKLDNQVPTNPEEGSDVQDYGPSGDNTPLITVTINMEKMFDSLPSSAQKTARESWWVNEGNWLFPDYQEHGYATAKSCGYTNNADWWTLVISCMDPEGQDYFKNNLFGQMFQGYAIKYESSDKGAFHCDGILTQDPPVYLAELYDTDKGHFVAAMAGGSEDDSNLSIGNVQKVYTEYLTGSKESDQVNWTSSSSGIYTDSKGDSYQLTLSFTPPMQGNALDFTKERENYYRAIVILTKDKIPTYKVTYDANGGNGGPTDNTSYRSGDTVNVQFTPVPTHTGYTFLGWDENKNVTEPTYKQGGTTSFEIQKKTTLYAIWQASNPALSVTKSVYQVNGQNYTTGSKVAVDDTIVYQIVVQNTGNVTLSNIAVSDMLGSQPLTVYSDASCANVVTAISSLAPNGTVTYYAKYQVAAADAGQTLTNTATASTGTTTNTGSVAVKVKGQPTITVVVENGTASAANLNNGKITLTEGGDATITFTANEKYVLDSVTVNEKPANLTENTYSFTNVTTDQTIKVVYALDNNGDGTADKYQVTINYVAGEGGSLTNPADDQVPSPYSHVVTITDKNGKPISEGTVSIFSMKAVPGSNYFFKDWTKKVDNGTETQYTINQTLSGKLEVTGGTVVTFTANFAPKTYAVAVDKTVTNDQGHKTLAIVGDTLSYTIQVTNNSNVPLENAVLTDSMWGTKVTSVQVSGIADPVDVSGGSYTIQNLPVNDTITQ